MQGGARYAVQLLLPEKVVLDAQHILVRLLRWRSDVELLTADPELAFSIPTADLPLVVHIFSAAPEAYPDRLCDALIWSQTWNERWDDTAARCHASIVIAMTSQRPVNHASMLLTFLAVLDTVLFSLDEPLRYQTVLHWMPAKQLLSFERYCQLRTELGPCGPAVNVRLVNATGRPGELLADTVGLAELGLPDLQTVFTDKDPNEVELKLRVMVRSLFVGDRLDCTWVEEAAYVPPRRDTLTLLLD